MCSRKNLSWFPVEIMERVKGHYYFEGTSYYFEGPNYYFEGTNYNFFRKKFIGFSLLFFYPCQVTGSVEDPVWKSWIFRELFLITYLFCIFLVVFLNNQVFKSHIHIHLNMGAHWHHIHPEHSLINRSESFPMSFRINCMMYVIVN